MIERVIIMGAAGRDFHNFNVYFRDNERYKVVAFTATQIPDIDGRVYPPTLAGRLYPEGVPIHPEEDLGALITKHKVDLVAFSYSDVTHEYVMHKGSLAMAHGADFILIGAPYTMLQPKKPVVAVCAVRTGCGKSQTTREVCRILQQRYDRVVAVRHPMPYGDLTKQEVQRFSSLDDCDAHQCTIEEREEYEPLIDKGITVYAGVDYEKILRAAEAEADVIVWDGGNNDTPFFRPDVHITIFDPHRAGHELTYYPGETNMLMADIAVIGKVDTASAEGVETVRANIRRHNPRATVVMAASPVAVDDPDAVHGKRVLVVEDGPTLTHGGMAIGAGVIAARRYGAGGLVDPRPWAAGSLARVFETYPHLGKVLPAMGYSDSQVRDLEQTINAAECDLVLAATPFDIGRIIHIDKPVLRVRYDYADHSGAGLEHVLLRKLERL